MWRISGKVTIGFKSRQLLGKRFQTNVGYDNGATENECVNFGAKKSCETYTTYSQ
jgi:hypothetical protein